MGSARVPEVRARRKMVVILAMEGMVDRWNKSGFWCGKDWSCIGIRWGKDWTYIGSR